MQNKHFSFIYCIESLVMEKKYKEWESCFQKTGLRSESVLDCYKNGKGKKVQHIAPSLLPICTVCYLSVQFPNCWLLIALLLIIKLVVFGELTDGYFLKYFKLMTGWITLKLDVVLSCQIFGSNFIKHIIIFLLQQLFMKCVHKNLLVYVYYNLDLCSTFFLCSTNWILIGSGCMHIHWAAGDKLVTIYSGCALILAAGDLFQSTC